MNDNPAKTVTNETNELDLLRAELIELNSRLEQVQIQCQQSAAAEKISVSPKLNQAFNLNKINRKKLLKHAGAAAGLILAGTAGATISSNDFAENTAQAADLGNLNFYLLEAPDRLVDTRTTQLYPFGGLTGPLQAVQINKFAGTEQPVPGGVAYHTSPFVFKVTGYGSRRRYVPTDAKAVVGSLNMTNFNITNLTTANERTPFTLSVEPYQLQYDPLNYTRSYVTYSRFAPTTLNFNTHPVFPGTGPFIKTFYSRLYQGRLQVVFIGVFPNAGTLPYVDAQLDLVIDIIGYYM